MFLKCHSEEQSDEESPKRSLTSSGFRDSSLPLVAQSDMRELIFSQIRFEKHILTAERDAGSLLRKFQTKGGSIDRKQYQP